jgi:hypothetical protein
MNTFKKPKNLNGQELIDQLSEVGIIVDAIYDNSDGTISFATDNVTKATEIVEKHNGTIIAPEPTIEDKLASVGLSLPDLKSALGLA